MSSPSLVSDSTTSNTLQVQDAAGDRADILHPAGEKGRSPALDEHRKPRRTAYMRATIADADRTAIAYGATGRSTRNPAWRAAHR